MNILNLHDFVFQSTVKKSKNYQDIPNWLNLPHCFQGNNEINQYIANE